MSITEFSAGLTANSGPNGLTAGPDGNLWFTENTNPDRLGRITPAGAITEFSAGLTPNSQLINITAGPDGNLWFAEFTNPGRIGRITPAGVITEFSAGLTANSGPFGITAGPDGNLWFTEILNPGRIGRITPAGVITEFTTGLTPNSGPAAITAGPDGNLWFTENTISGIGRITPAGVITEFRTGLTQHPSNITAGPDGNLWFTENTNPGVIGRITPAGIITEFTTGLTPNSTPTGITAGPDGNLWFTLNANPGYIGQITPAGVITEFSTGLTPNSGPQVITTGSDGNLWFTEFTNPGRIGQVSGVSILTTTTLTTSGSSSAFGQNVTFTATVAASNATVTLPPAGTVSFLDGGTLLGTGNIVNGVGTFNSTTLSVGSHSITAVFNPTGSFTGSTSTSFTQIVTVAPTPPTPPPPTPPPPVPAKVHYYATGADAGAEPQVNVYNAATGALVTSFFGLPAGFTGGARVAVGDVNGDGTDDIIVGAGPGAAPQVTVYDGKTFQPIMSFYGLPVGFTGGVFVAAGDVNHDGFADIIVSADRGGGPQVTITSGKDGTMLASFYATASTFTGGIRVACADINGDGFADVIAAAGPGGGPQVTIFNGKSLSLLTAFYALPSTFTGGMYIAAGDVNGDGKADILVGAAPGGGPEVSVFNGPNQQPIGAFFALTPTFTGGVRVAAADTTGSSHASILTAAGPGGGPQVSSFDGLSLQLLNSFYAYPSGFTGGVFVAGN